MIISRKFLTLRVTYAARNIDMAVMAPIGQVKASESKWLKPKPLITTVPNVPMAPEGTPL